MANETALLTLDAAASELAEKGLTPAPGYPVLYKPNGTPLLARDAYLADHANEVLQILPAWTEWCIERSGLASEAAELALEAARAQASDLVDEDYTPRPERMAPIGLPPIAGSMWARSTEQ